MSPSEAFFQSHPVFTYEEYARSRLGGSPRTVDSLLPKHVQSGRIGRVRRGLYVSVPPGTCAEDLRRRWMKSVRQARLSFNRERAQSRRARLVFRLQGKIDRCDDPRRLDRAGVALSPLVEPPRN